MNYPDAILSSFEEIGRLPGPPPFRLDPGAVCLEFTQFSSRNIDVRVVPDLRMAPLRIIRTSINFARELFETDLEQEEEN